MAGLDRDQLLHGSGRGRRRRDRVTAPARAGRVGRRAPAGDTVRAYIALTKPRIIELLLVTTVPAMVLATREVPRHRLDRLGVLVVWTLVGGTLAAGSANAINCYLDRDIDLLMTPDPAPAAAGPRRSSRSARSSSGSCSASSRSR